ncbi:hypothetical protein RRG08_066049 [Elysia crispata]|uniref:Uncharacterized protein n=1 Tax=Elysia crispata TaxID=231223 RepID=A0AAE0Y2P9_9GAST|nr:hypothetical protein RRG08_066049 [Elysia crispata]
MNLFSALQFPELKHASYGVPRVSTQMNTSSVTVLISTHINNVPHITYITSVIAILTFLNHHAIKLKIISIIIFNFYFATLRPGARIAEELGTSYLTLKSEILSLIRYPARGEVTFLVYAWRCLKHGAGGKG